jgi:hypothetical protein
MTKYVSSLYVYTMISMIYRDNIKFCFICNADNPIQKEVKKREHNTKDSSSTWQLPSYSYLLKQAKFYVYFRDTKVVHEISKIIGVTSVTIFIIAIDSIYSHCFCCFY